MYFVFEILGTVAFAISGAMVGIKNRMDILGVAVLGMTTAVGGGIIRDLIIGLTPPMAFQKPVYALVAIAVSLTVFLPPIRQHVNVDSPLLNLVDAIGLGIFTVTGVRAGMAYDSLFLQVFLGTLTGVGGGVMRDVFAAEKPMIFVRHFYAVASMTGAVICALLYGTDANLAMLAGTAVIIVLRILAAKYRWHLPKA